MLNAEHLLENAICELEKYEVHEAYKQFMESPCNIELAENAGIRLDDVWVMAVYCCATLRQDWKEKWEDEAEELINSQKTEIERLEAYNENLQTANVALSNELLDAKPEAIKEFTERLKEKAKMPLGTLYGQMVYAKDIDELVKEMTEESDEKTD